MLKNAEKTWLINQFTTNPTSTSIQLINSFIAQFGSATESHLKVETFLKRKEPKNKKRFGGLAQPSRRNLSKKKYR